ncbi:MAG TPA: ATP-binding protein, partial [Sandaracinaceae bacterium]
ALAILALSTAIVLARTDVGLGALLAGQGPGGQLARRMLPAAVLIPAVLGMVRVMGERHGYLSTELGTALLITTTVVLFAGASTWSAAALSRVDLARRATHRALREENLAHELERRTLRAVLEVLPVGAVITDASGRVLEVGPAARAIFGDRGRDPDVLRRYERLAGRDAATYAPLRPEDWVIARALARGETCTGQEIDVEAFDGSTKTVLASAAPIRDQRGHIAGAVGILVDITERKRAERELSSLKEELEQRVRERTAELEAANAELEALSYSISHDLRAPLRWIDGFARALSEDHAEALGESGREHLAQLHDSVRQMRELMDALLGLAHVTARPLERSRVDVGALARELARAIETENEDRRVEWRIVDGVTVDADPRLLRIALDNLLRNAWKFTRARDPAHIEVGAERADGELAIFVRDDGVGFDPRLATSLFRPFTRLHPADEYEGTGIGLALVRRIAQRHGGRAWAMAEPGRGATFYVTLAPSGGPS